MNFTAYSLIMAIVWFDIFILLGSLLQRKIGLFLNYNFYPVVLLIVLSLIRLFAPVETPLTIIIRSDTIAPAIQSALKSDIALSKSVSLPIFEAIVFALTAISLILLVRFFRACWHEHKMVNAFVETSDNRLLGLMDEIVLETKPGQAYRLCVFDQNFSPSICGLRTPVIILSEAILTLTDQDIRHILMHEWQHYLEKDLWVRFFIEVLCCVMWWNPVVYLLKKDIDQTFELKCDLKTTERLSENDRLDYLSTLLKVARMQQPEQKRAVAIHFTGSSSGSAAMAANARQRFQAVLKYGKRNRKIEVLSVALLLGLFLMSFRFVVQPFILPPMDDLAELEDPNKGLIGKDLVGIVRPTTENAYILQKENGEFLLYINGDIIRELCREELQNETHRNLPIINEKKE